MDLRIELSEEDRRLEMEDEDRRAETEDGVYDLSDLDTKPRATYQVEPTYPPELKEKGVEGSAIVEWIITNKGKTKNIRSASATHDGFAVSATAAIEKTKWKPGKIDGKAVSVRVRQKLDFTLNDDEE